LTFTILNPGLRGYLRKLFPKILRSLPGCEILEYNIQVDLDHLHMIMIIPPKYSVSDIIGQIKAQSASRLEEKVFLAVKSILERKHRLVTRLFCFNSRHWWEKYHQVCSIPRKPGFRSSEAWMVL